MRVPKMIKTFGDAGRTCTWGRHKCGKRVDIVR